MYDTIIIGAGMSGLAAGIRLAHFGQRVCLLERHTAIGGLNSYYRQRGRIFDVGLHAITNFVPKGTRTGPFAQLLRRAMAKDRNVRPKSVDDFLREFRMIRVFRSTPVVKS